MRQTRVPIVLVCMAMAVLANGERVMLVMSWMTLKRSFERTARSILSEVPGRRGTSDIGYVRRSKMLLTTAVGFTLSTMIAPKLSLKTLVESI